MLIRTNASMSAILGLISFRLLLEMFRVLRLVMFSKDSGRMDSLLL